MCHIKRVHITLTELIANKKSNRYSAIFGNWESLSIHIVREGTFQVDKLVIRTVYRVGDLLAFCRFLNTGRGFVKEL